MRVVVVGTSGSGKSTFGRQLAAAIGAPVLELDAINWQPGWVDLNNHDPAEFYRRVAAAAAADAWVADGNYTKVRQALWPRATAFVWMDPSRSQVMRQVIWRSFSRAITKRELWPGTGNTEQFSKWLDREHPIRWAWDHFAPNRARYGEAFGGGVSEGRSAYRVGTRAEGRALIAKLRAEALPN